MEKIDAVEAKTRLSELLRGTEKGRTFLICRRGKEVAQLLPPAAAEREQEIQNIAAGFRKIRAKIQGKVNIRELIDRCRCLGKYRDICSRSEEVLYLAPSLLGPGNYNIRRRLPRGGKRGGVCLVCGKKIPFLLSPRSGRIVFHCRPLTGNEKINIPLRSLRTLFEDDLVFSTTRFALYAMRLLQ